MARTMRPDALGSAAGVLAPRKPRIERSPGRPGDVAEPPRPPRPPDDGRGDGDGGGDPERPRGPGFGGEPPAGAKYFALTLALAGIGTLFAVFLASWFLLRRHEPDAVRASPLVPPNALWLSTLVLAASGVAIERAARSTGRRAVRWIHAALWLGLGFLAAQAYLWWILLREGIVPSSGAYGAVFFALTGLHAAHVLGGLGCMTFAALRARRARLGPDTLRLCAIYWHFMGGLWVAIFAVLYFVR